MSVPQLQFVDVAVLSSLALISAGIVLFIKSMQRRELAEESGSGARIDGWRALVVRRLRRYAVAAAVLAICLLVAGLLLFSGGAAA